MEISELYKIFEQHPVVTTDSRDCPQGSIFFALKGASFNGNAFAAKAIEQGCAYAVVDEQEYAPQGDERFILTDDCLKTLQRLPITIGVTSELKSSALQARTVKQQQRNSWRRFWKRNTMCCTRRATSTMILVCRKHCFVLSLSMKSL